MLDRVWEQELSACSTINQTLSKNVRNPWFAGNIVCSCQDIIDRVKIMNQYNSQPQIYLISTIWLNLQMKKVTFAQNLYKDLSIFFILRRLRYSTRVFVDEMKQFDLVEAFHLLRDIVKTWELKNLFFVFHFQFCYC